MLYIYYLLCIYWTKYLRLNICITDYIFYICIDYNKIKLKYKYDTF